MTRSRALVDRAGSLLDRPGRVLLGVTGAPGAGKSTLTETLLSQLRANEGEDAIGHLPMDG
ncbi:MAG TPA: nucleoside/nucleotide kinase family protein, partial [Nocardioides sp.]|nr:nucleoside/nucleotide kinase family protein [Nocardioides sp.]